MYVANPNSNNVSIINLKTGKVENIAANKVQVGIKYHGILNKIVVSNWYDDTITIIDQDKEKNNKVGKSPAGIDIHPITGQIVVANRDSNTVNIIEDLNKKIISTIKFKNLHLVFSLAVTVKNFMYQMFNQIQLVLLISNHVKL